MAWRNLRAFIVYRIKKKLLGLNRTGLQQARKAKARDKGNQNPGDDQSMNDFYTENRMVKPEQHRGHYQAGLEGGKQGDWLPDDLDLGSSSEAGRLIRKLVTTISRRKKQGYKRKTINIRRTIHRNMHYGGTLLKMSWQMRKPAAPRVMLILDTSSSMLPSAKMMLQFLYALKNELSRIEVFIFGNQLNYVTPYLNRDFDGLIKEISQLPQWNYGGTELWRPLAQLRDHYPHLINSRTVVILLTDCQFYEKFFALAPLERLRRKVKRLYLFNPHPQTRDLGDFYYQETIENFKTVVDRMFYTSSIHEVAKALRQII